MNKELIKSLINFKTGDTDDCLSLTLVLELITILGNTIKIISEIDEGTYYYILPNELDEVFTFSLRKLRLISKESSMQNLFLLKKTVLKKSRHSLILNSEINKLEGNFYAVKSKSSSYLEELREIYNITKGLKEINVCEERLPDSIKPFIDDCCAQIESAKKSISDDIDRNTHAYTEEYLESEFRRNTEFIEAYENKIGPKYSDNRREVDLNKVQEHKKSDNKITYNKTTCMLSYKDKNTYIRRGKLMRLLLEYLFEAKVKLVDIPEVLNQKELDPLTKTRSISDCIKNINKKVIELGVEIDVFDLREDKILIKETYKDDLQMISE